jgi:hypothetical protein
MLLQKGSPCLQAALPAELDVKVLTTGFWPTYRSPDLTLPREMAMCVQSFEAWHSSITRNRKLTWMYNLVGLFADLASTLFAWLGICLSDLCARSMPQSQQCSMKHPEMVVAALLKHRFVNAV